MHLFILRGTIFSILLISALALSGCFLRSDSRDNKSLTFTTVATLAAPDSKIGEPFGIAVREGAVYVSDGEAGSILKLDSDGTMTSFATGFNTPSGIAFAPDGKLIVTDTGSHTVKSVDASGAVNIVAGIENVSGTHDGPSTVATFNAPIGVAVTDEGAIYVADTYNDRIRLIRDAGVTTIAGGSRGFADGAGSGAKFDTPLGLAIWQNKLLVADSGNRRIRVMEFSGDVWTLAGSDDDNLRDGDLSRAAFAMPTAVEATDDGRIFVADGHSVRVIGRRAFPFVETLGGERRGFADGRSSRARFNRPSGLALGPRGEILVADSENQALRVISDGAHGRELSSQEIASYRMSAEQFRKLQPPRWPYDPPHAPREVAGTLGEIRGEIRATDTPHWFHNGLDIAGAYGETAKFIRSETVLDPHSAQNFGTARELIRLPDIGYIHLRLGRDSADVPITDDRFQFQRDEEGKLIDVRVRRGTHFRAGEIVGTLNSQNHVHLIAGSSGSEMNALAALELPGVSDSIAPVIDELEMLDHSWGEISVVSGVQRIKIGDRLRVVVDAYDRMDGNAERRRLGVYRLGYQIITNGTPLADTDWTIVFDRMPSNDAVRFVYAPGSRSGARGVTTFRYIATNRVSGDNFAEGSIDTSALGPGVYALRAFVADYFGNTTWKEIKFEISG